MSKGENKSDVEEAVKSSPVSAAGVDWNGAVIVSRRCHSIVSAGIITGTAQKAAEGLSEMMPQWNKNLHSSNYSARF